MPVKYISKRFPLEVKCDVQDPMPRQRRRKALPEKIPPMMSPIKSLFGRRTNAGLMLGLPGHPAAPGGLPGVCFPGAASPHPLAHHVHGNPKLHLNSCYV